MGKLNAAEIKNGLKEIAQWTKKGSAITCTYQFKDFPAAMKFMGAVAKIAEKAQHHPDINIRWNEVMLRLTTHDQGGLTDKDFSAAKKFDDASVRTMS